MADTTLEYPVESNSGILVKKWSEDESRDSISLDVSPLHVTHDNIYSVKFDMVKVKAKIPNSHYAAALFRDLREKYGYLNQPRFKFAGNILLYARNVEDEARERELGMSGVYVTMELENDEDATRKFETEVTVEYNPAKVTPESAAWLYFNVIQHWHAPRLTRLDLAIDLINVDLSKLMVRNSIAAQSTIHYRGGRWESMYFGVRSSKSYFSRFYDKKRERQVKGFEGEVPTDVQEWWRLEAELHGGDQIAKWERAFDRFAIGGTALQLIPDVEERALVEHFWRHPEDLRTETLSKHKKTKYRKIIDDSFRRFGFDIMPAIREELSIRIEGYQGLRQELVDMFHLKTQNDYDYLIGKTKELKRDETASEYINSVISDLSNNTK